MILRTPARRSAALFALVAPLALAACGSNGEEEAQADGAESTVASTVTKTSEKPKGDASETKDEDKDKDAKENSGRQQSSAEAAADDAGNEPGNTAAPRDHGNQDPINPPQGDAAEPVVMPPVEGGQPADPATADEINQLVRGMYDTTTMREYVGYLPEHTCQRALDEGGYSEIDLEQIPDIPMSSLDEQGWNEAYVESVDDIQVDNDKASATVKIHTVKGEDANTLRFLREGDRWTFCNV